MRELNHRDLYRFCKEAEEINYGLPWGAKASTHVCVQLTAKRKKMGRFSDILAGQRFDWRIRLIEKADRKNPVIDERFAGTELEAEHRLTDVWNAARVPCSTATDATRRLCTGWASGRCG